MNNEGFELQSLDVSTIRCSFSRSIPHRKVRGGVDLRQAITRRFHSDAIRERRFDARSDPSTGSFLFLVIHTSGTACDIINMLILILINIHGKDILLKYLKI